MRPLLLAALVVVPSLALASADRRVSLAQATPSPATPAAPAVDEEDEEEVGPSTPKPPTPPEPPAPAAAKPTPATREEPGRADTAPAAAGDTATTSEQQQQLISGAPLYNPNVAVHTVENKAFSDRLRHEVVLYPGAAQVNGRFTQHYGSALSYIFHLQENFALYVSPLYNWYATESSFNTELINKVNYQAQHAAALLLTWGVYGGVEVTPLYGKFAFYDGSLAQFSIVLSGGAGMAATKIQLKPYNIETGAATFGDTGNRFLGEVGGGFRLQLGKRFTFRLEVRDLVYTARVDAVNGCNSEDLDAIRTSPNASVSPGCNVDAFTQSVDPVVDLGIATDRVRLPSSDVLNNVGVYAGFGIVF